MLDNSSAWVYEYYTAPDGFRYFLESINMAKKVHDVAVDPQSIEDAGFQWGFNSSKQSSIASYLMGLIPGLGNPDVAQSDQLPKEQKDRLKVGLMNHYAQSVKPCVYYVIADGNPVEKTEAEFNAFNGEKRRLDIHIASAVDQSTLTYLRENEKAWYGLVQDLKTDFSQYFSNACREIISRSKSIYAKKHGLKRERSLTLVFEMREKKMLADLLQYCITADSRGNDPTADVALTKKRIAAYFAVTK